MQIVAQWATDQGRVRAHNEDFGLMDPGAGIYVVCDGMGGHQAGDVASRTAAETVQRILREHHQTLQMFAAGQCPSDQPIALIRHAIETASTTVFQLGQQTQGQGGMGTTCTMLAVCGGKAIMGHVGDSRMYLLRGGQVYQLSEDHTYLNEAIRRGMLTPEQAAHSEYSNVITRAVGTQPGAQVDTLVFDVVPGDTLLLCSDGLTGYLKDPAEVAQLLSDPDLDALPQRLVALANERGGEDNITAMCLRVPAQAPEADAEHAMRVTSNYEALRQIEVFSELHLADLARVLTAFARHRVDRGEVIVTEGESSNTMFVIVAGEAEVLRQGERRAVLGTGAHFGEMALLSQRPRSATVRTTKPTDLLVTDRERFYTMLREDSMLAAGILWRLAQTLSVRLDEVYDLQGQPKKPVNLKSTLAHGMLSSPFDRRSLF